MSTATLDKSHLADDADTIQYRAIPAGAVVGLTFLVFTALFTCIAGSVSSDNLIFVSILNLVPLVICFFAFRKIRREPEIYTGGQVALVGAVLSAVFLVAGVGYGEYVRVTEVPPNHEPISFTELRPDVVEERAGVYVPPEIVKLDGQRVFIKGYMRPQEVTSGISQFLLVRDNNQCCFGDISSVKYYDRILVDLTGSLRLKYSPELFSIGGVLQVMPQNIRYGPEAPVFALRADYAK